MNVFLQVLYLHQIYEIADFIIPKMYANKLPTNHIIPLTSDEIKDCKIKR